MKYTTTSLFALSSLLFSGCANLCGNGVIDRQEECDDGTANSDETPGACRTSCLLPACGDGIADPGQACFETPRIIESRAHVETGAVLDLNGDSLADLVLANQDQQIQLLFGNGQGNFAETATPLTLEGTPRRLDIQQINSDDLSDVLVLQEEGDIACFLGRGNGFFDTGVLSTTEVNPRDFLFFDVNGDSLLDVLYVFSDGLEVLKGDGLCNFTPLFRTTLQTSNPGTISLLDLDSDSDNDLLITDVAEPTLNRVINNGNGSFFDGNLTNLAPASRLLLGDFDGDTRSDIIGASSVSGEIFTAKGLGGIGEFDTPKFLATGDVVERLFLLDINKDTVSDLVTTGGATLAFLQGQGVGDFATPRIFWAGAEGKELLIADINSDQVSDYLVLGALGASVIDGRAGDFPRGVDVLLSEDLPSAAVSADLDGDADLDLAVATQEGVVLLNNVGGRLTRGATLDLNARPLSLAAADLDADGDADLAVLDETGNNILLFSSDAGVFDTTQSVVIPAPPQTNALLLLDSDHDGVLDIVTLGETPALLRGVVGGFEDAVLLPVGAATEGLAVDIDQDGQEELVLRVGEDLKVLQGNTEVATINVGIVSAFAFANLDNTSDLDLVTTRDDTVRVQLATGSFGVGSSITAQLGQDVHSIGSADTDGDNLPELIVAGSTISFVLGLKDKQLETRQIISAGNLGTALQTTDTNLDGMQELVFVTTAGLILSQQLR